MAPVDGDNQEEIAASLVARIQEGDEQAETEMVETYRRGLTYQLRRMCTDHALCDDLFQDTFQVVLEKIREGKLEQPERLAGFIRKTAQNLYIADYRKKKRRDTHGGLDERTAVTDEEADPHERMERELLANLVRRVISEMSVERDRLILYQFYVVQEDKQAICHALAIEPQIFNRILYRARQRFKELWLEKGYEIDRLLVFMLSR